MQPTRLCETRHEANLRAARTYVVMQPRHEAFYSFAFAGSEPYGACAAWGGTIQVVPYKLLAPSMRSVSPARAIDPPRSAQFHRGRGAERAPVTYAAPGDSRKQMALETSSTVPSLLNGIRST